LGRGAETAAREHALTNGGAAPVRRFVVMGVAGAGKSLIGARFAAALGAAFADGDDFHPPANVARMAAGIPLTDVDRAGWLTALAARLAAARRADEGLVVACSALKRAYRDVLRNGDPALQLIFLTGPAPLIGDRLGARAGHFMPPALLASQLATLEPPEADEAPWVCEVADTPEHIVEHLVTLAGAR
jgi:gluconokinase